MTRGSRVPWPYTACVPLRVTRSWESENAKGSRDGHGSRYFACVPHADGLCGLLHVPRNCPFCGHAAWFGRTAARTCTWTVRPPRRRLMALVPRLPDVPSVIRV